MPPDYPDHHAAPLPHPGPVQVRSRSRDAVTARPGSGLSLMPSGITGDLASVCQRAHRMDQSHLVGGSAAANLWDEGCALVWEALAKLQGAIAANHPEWAAEAIAARNDARMRDAEIDGLFREAAD